MEPRHARYPFLPAAREAVEAADTDLAAVIGEEGPVVERAVARVEEAIESHSVGEEHRTERVELLSYPVARVLVSLVDEPALTRRYASAEAETAVERLRADGDDAAALRSVERERLSRAEFLAALGLGDAISETDVGASIDVATYLRLTDDLDGDRWRLVNRALADGRVPVSTVELDDLVRAAVRERVEADLPLAVPETVADALVGQVNAILSMLSDFSVERSFDAVEPESFPPCVKALGERVRDGGPLPDHSRFAYVSFLATVGMDGDEIAARLSAHPDADEEAERYRIDHLTDRGAAAYLPPSCATMQAYGDCVNQDSLCAQIAHPLEYYERRLDGVEPGPEEASGGGDASGSAGSDGQTSRPESQ